jgi:hypothetical protein
MPIQAEPTWHMKCIPAGQYKIAYVRDNHVSDNPQWSCSRNDLARAFRSHRVESPRSYSYIKPRLSLSVIFEEDAVEPSTLRREELVVASKELPEYALVLPVANAQAFELLHPVLERPAGVSELCCDVASLVCAN